MGSLTGRWTAKEDVSVLSIDGEDVKALFRNASLEFSVAEIDMNAAQDGWNRREIGTRDWRMTCSTLVAAEPSWVDGVIDGNLSVVSFVCDEFDFLATGLITGVTLNIDNPGTEEVTVVQAMEDPTIT